MADDLEQRIRERAYEIWENEGCPAGRDSEHWERACADYRDAKTEADSEQADLSAGEAGANSETALASAEEAPLAEKPSRRRGEAGGGGGAAAS